MYWFGESVYGGNWEVGEESGERAASGAVLHWSLEIFLTFIYKSASCSFRHSWVSVILYLGIVTSLISGKSAGCAHLCFYNPHLLPTSFNMWKSGKFWAALTTWIIQQMGYETDKLQKSRSKQFREAFGLVKKKGS